MRTGRMGTGEPGEGADEGRRRPPEDSAALLRRAIRLLGVQERSEADLRVRLLRYGPPEAVEEALGRLRVLGYVNDRRFSENFTEQRALEDGMGARRVGFELRRHGIGGELLAQSVDRAAQAEEDGARRVAERMTRHLASLPAEVRARRLAGALARRGFRSDVIARILRETAREAAGDNVRHRPGVIEAEALAEALEQEASGEEEGTDALAGAGGEPFPGPGEDGA